MCVRYIHTTALYYSDTGVFIPSARPYDTQWLGSCVGLGPRLDFMLKKKLPHGPPPLSAFDGLAILAQINVKGIRFVVRSVMPLE